MHPLLRRPNHSNRHPPLHTQASFPKALAIFLCPQIQDVVNTKMIGMYFLTDLILTPLCLGTIVGRLFFEKYLAP